jgi:dTDP-glucose 4,6-dehydratase
VTRRYVVTGGAGFLGTHLCRALLDAGAEVLVLDDLSSSSHPSPELRETGRYWFVQTDVTVSLARDAWPAGFTTGDVVGVFHLASPASPADYTAHQVSTLRAGALGTEAALRLALELDARMVFTSTSEVYGDPLEHPQREDYWGNVNPIGVRSAYDEAKRYAEALCFAFLRETTVDVGIARLFNTYGPGMRAGDGRFIPTLIRQALRGTDLTIHGDGQQTRSFCYVSDTIAGLMRLMDASGLTGPFNLGNPVEQTIESVAELIIESVGGGSSIQYIERPVDDPERRQPLIDRAERELGWRPTVGFAEGLALTIASMRAEVET